MRCSVVFFCSFELLWSHMLWFSVKRPWIIPSFPTNRIIYIYHRSRALNLWCKVAYDITLVLQEIKTLISTLANNGFQKEKHLQLVIMILKNNICNNRVQGKRPHRFASRYVLKYCTNILKIDIYKRDRNICL